VEEVVPEAALSLLSIQHEVQGLALVGPQLHSQALHMHHVSSTWHHAGQAYNHLTAVHGHSKATSCTAVSGVSINAVCSVALRRKY